DEPAVAKNPFPIVGIGASAGGLEAFTQLLSQLPENTGMAFVLVQHLDPDHPSQLTNLLAKATTMPVREVTDGMAIEPDHVFVIPPNVNMGISQGKLKLTPRDEKRVPHLPVNFLFCSLAKEQQSSAIGVILSGTGSDGAVGLAEIKGAGGITFAQDEKSAKFSGMPLHAAGGYVDFILPPGKIAQELARIGRDPYLVLPAKTGSEEKSAEITKDFRRILAILRSHSGVDFSQYRDSTIKRRIQRRMVVHTRRSLADYIKLLERDGGEVKGLFEDVLINVTSFFRDPEMFEALKAEVFPEILKSAPQAIRIWVPACSTGQEAYSIAIALLEFLENKPIPPAIQIFATDVNETISIEKARRGFYPESIEGEISSERLRRYFTKEDGGYRISKAIRDLCIFAKQNIISDPPFSRMDLISCRNLLIYFTPNLQRHVVSMFHYALNPTGYLVLGSSETVGANSDLFSTLDRKYKIYSKIGTAVRPFSHFTAEDLKPGALAAARGKTSYAPGAANEELKCANEEVLSSNEELQSTNEQLGTAKEELQSTNEELVTLNEELQTRNVELNQLNRDLNEAHEKLLDYAAAIVDTVRSPLLVLRADLQVHKANDAFYKTFRVTAAETENHLIYELGEGQWNLHELQRLFSEILPKKTVLKDFEVAHLFPKIGRRVMLLNARQLEPKKGAPPLILLSIEDVTEFRQIEEVNRWLAAIVESSDDAIIGKDIDGKVISCNRGASKLFGYASEELIGKPVTILIPPERQDEEKTILARIRNDEHIENFQTVRRRKDGSLIQVSLTISPVKDAEGKIIGASKIARDVTQQKITEARLANQTEELEKLVVQRTANLTDTIKSLENLCYTMAHDLRGPLRSMAGFTELLLEECAPGLDEHGKDYARRIRNSSLQMDQLIRGLLEYGKLSQGGLAGASVSLETCVCAVLGQMTEEIGNVDAEIELKRPLPAVHGNEVILQQVLVNLIRNALKFVAPGVTPKIRVWCEQNGNEKLTRLWIEDNGIGIAPEHHERIFGLFQRLNENYPGTGIGLAIVRKGMEQMGGNAGVESEPGRGSRFWIELPKTGK
ncbi:MAG: chemotaxis protein CheB, partial [Limisphaerales bacterium]